MRLERFRMFSEPRRHGPRGSDVAEGAGDRRAGRHAAARDSVQGTGEGLREGRVHDPVKGDARKTFLRNAASTPHEIPPVARQTDSTPSKPGGSVPLERPIVPRTTCSIT